MVVKVVLLTVMVRVRLRRDVGVWRMWFDGEGRVKCVGESVRRDYCWGLGWR